MTSLVAWAVHVGRLPACWDRPRTTRKRPVGGQGTAPCSADCGDGLFPITMSICTPTPGQNKTLARVRGYLLHCICLWACIFPYSTVALLYPAHRRIHVDIPPTEWPSAWWLGYGCIAPRELGRGLLQWQCHGRCFRPPGLYALARAFFSPHPLPFDPNTPAFRTRQHHDSMQHIDVTLFIFPFASTYTQSHLQKNHNTNFHAARYSIYLPNQIPRLTPLATRARFPMPKTYHYCGMLNTLPPPTPVPLQTRPISPRPHSHFLFSPTTSSVHREP
ncbi:hypothetical protein GGP41_000068 [Bipolaris sorokiniana]|uniref:Uncharacterized protein n=1 Tax=Cochliobolus sativus TaxID=45130 RepID=A0A8H5ZG00_COCSA|nr:hypothetical protein GGP41_000068 [Bipolaris sorokiniana]